jgi:ATP-dependent DNA ligase
MFDILYLNGEVLLDKSYETRREILKKNIKVELYSLSIISLESYFTRSRLYRIASN